MVRLDGTRQSLLILLLEERLACPGAAEVNGDASLDMSDSVSLLRHLFMGGDLPADPAARECQVGG